MNGFTTERGKIITENGMAVEPCWFCDGRISFKYENCEISQVSYFGPETKGRAVAFMRHFWNGLRLYTVKDRVHKLLRPESCEILPFGFRSVSDDIEFSIYTANDFIFLTVTPQYDCDISLEFYGDFLMYPRRDGKGDIRYLGVEREWAEFKTQGDIISGGYTEDGVFTKISFSSNHDLCLNISERNDKHSFVSKSVRRYEECVIAIHFTNGEAKDYKGFAEILAKQFLRYQTVAQNAPKLQSSKKYLNQFFELAPVYHESMKVTEVRGALRAQTVMYWVWGWDSMTSPQAMVYWGDNEFLGDMLHLMEKHSHPEKGIPHGFTRSMELEWEAPPPAQGMYITLLDLYRISGGDYKKYYPFAKKLFKKILDTEVNNTGLCSGETLYPDFRELLHEDGNDISAFNNTVCYCSARSLEQLAADFGDSETQKIACDFADRCLASFSKTLFNKELGFFDSSVDTKEFKPRNVPGNNCIKWENNFCGDLTLSHAEECLKFYKENLISKAGLRPYPVWVDAYDTDANQLNCWWPVMSEFYTRLINKFDCPELLNQFVSWIEYWTKLLICPEGISCYDDSNEVLLDRWNCQSGMWHAYSIRGFYNAVVHSFVGVDFDAHGINFYPYSGEELDLLNLNFGKRKFDIHIKGSGKNILGIVLNGENIGIKNSIPFKDLDDYNDIVVIRG